jgi:hypothetical protein
MAWVERKPVEPVCGHDFPRAHTRRGRPLIGIGSIWFCRHCRHYFRYDGVPEGLWTPVVPRGPDTPSTMASTLR